MASTSIRLRKLQKKNKRSRRVHAHYNGTKAAVIHEARNPNLQLFLYKQSHQFEQNLQCEKQYTDGLHHTKDVRVRIKLRHGVQDHHCGRNHDDGQTLLWEKREMVS